MAYFIPSFIQKRILRYALSRFELFEINDFDLDNLDIAWGKRSAFELKEVGIQLQKLSTLLQLPPKITLLKAKISLLRVTVPADLYKSGILIEAHGLRIALAVEEEDVGVNEDQGQPGNEAGDRESQEGPKTDRPRNTQYHVHDPGGDNARSAAHIPTAINLAESFLEAEPPKERVELQHALEHSQSVSQSQGGSPFDRDISDAGLGGGISLPGFVSEFLKGIADRVQLSVKNAEVEFTIGLQLPSEDGNLNERLRLEAVMLKVVIEEVELAGIANASAAPTFDNGESESHYEVLGEPLSEASSRRIMLRNIRAMLVADSSLFSNLTSSTIPLSPNCTNSPSRRSNVDKSPSCTHPEPSSPNAAFETDSFVAHDRAFSQDTSHNLYASLRSDNGNDAHDGASPGMVGDSIRDPPVAMNKPTADSIEGSFMTSKSVYDSHSTPMDMPGSFGKPLFSSHGQGLQRGPSARNEKPAQADARFPYPESPLSQSQVSESGQSSPQLQNLAQSMLFSHEEAESMYMSAMTTTPNTKSALKPMPGDWEDSDSEKGESTDSTGQAINKVMDSPPSGVLGTTSVAGAYSLGSLSSSKEGTSLPKTPRPLKDQAELVETTSPTSSEQASPGLSQASALKSHSETAVTKTILIAENVFVELPTSQVANENADSPGHQTMTSEPVSPPFSTKSSSRTNVKVGNVKILGDLGLIKLAIILSQQLTELLRPSPSEPEETAKHSEVSNGIVVRFKRLSWQFLGLVRGMSTSSPSSLSPYLQATGRSNETDVLLKATVLKLKLSFEKDASSSTTLISIGKFSFGYPGENIVSFDSGLKLRDSPRDSLVPLGQDVLFKVVQSPSLRHCELTTLPLHIRLDLRRLDETFSWFGGFSSFIGLGNSMVSTITVVERRSERSAAEKSARGVRFKGLETPEQPQKSPKTLKQKVTVRVASIVLDVEGASCSFRFETTAVKSVVREEGVGLAIDRVSVTGPYVGSKATTSSVTSKLVALRVEYLGIPKDVDLARLLALLSPSKHGYEEEDDGILLGTLFRQRRQGGVVRITAEKIEANVLDPKVLYCLGTIGEEMKKLSTVAKYLPEDDRPGIMTLVLVREANATVVFEDDIGAVRITMTDAEAAHVNIPRLVAVGIGKLKVVRNTTEELIGDLASPYVPGKSPPTIMTRFIGNELDPTVKIKLRSLRVEYHVSTITAILGFQGVVTHETLVHLANSAMTVTDSQRRECSPSKVATQPSSKSESAFMGFKELIIDLTAQDVVLGLNPTGSPCRGLLVLTDARLESSLPKDGNLNARLKISKASMLAIDDANILEAPNPNSLHSPSSDRENQVQLLLDMGYVPLSYISAAKATLEVVRSVTDNSKTVEVEFRDSLVVIESCADSSQTLHTLFSGLQPPSVPSKESKYRTEVVPVEDMLASFSGNAFFEPGKDARHSREIPLDLDEGDMVEDDVPQNLEYVSSFYNPDPDSLDESIADSMLEENMETLSYPVANRNIGNKPLLESFEERYQVAADESTLDFREDHFDNRSNVGGTAHRCIVKENAYALNDEPRGRASPLRIRVRDVHIIWNLFDGYDWQHTRNTISQAVAAVEEKATEQRSKRHRRRSEDSEEEQDTVIGDFLFNSIYIGVPANRDPKDLSCQISHNIDDLASETESYATSSASSSPSRQNRTPRLKGKKLRLRRSKYHKITFELKGVSADLVVFPPELGETQSSIDIRVHDFEIFDHVPASTWKKFATYMHDAGERESGTSMLHLEILNVKPVADLAASEMILKVGIYHHAPP